MKTQIFAHRGYPVKFPENSLQGFKYAIDHGADGLEFDVHLTKDNVPVIMHDEKIDRTTKGHGKIHDYTYDQLKKYPLANGETIPLLKDFLKLVGNHDIHLNLEFKTNQIHYKGIEKIVLDMVKDHQLRYPVIYSSFYLKSLKIAQKIDPNQIYCFLTDKRFLNPKAFIKKEHLTSLHPGYYAQGIEDMERIYTIDDVPTMKKLFKKHVQGIFTNDFVKAMKVRNEIQK
ncbi:MAG: glycerophosphodiester phosphodiesterase [Acetilactobacillus jinshanensis]